MMTTTRQLSGSDLLDEMLEADRQVQLLTDPMLLALAELRFRNAFVVYQLGLDGTGDNQTTNRVCSYATA